MKLTKGQKRNYVNVRTDANIEMMIETDNFKYWK